MNDLPIKAFNRMIEKRGAKLHAFWRGGHKAFRGFVDDYRHKRRTVSSVDALADTRLLPGIDTKRCKVLYTVYDEFWENTADIRVLYRGRTYNALFDTPVFIGDKPIYVWAVLSPIAAIEDDYDDIEEDEYYDDE